MDEAVSKVIKHSAASRIRTRARTSVRPVHSSKLTAKEIAAEQEVAALAAEAVSLLARGRPANIQAGRRFIKIRARLGSEAQKRFVDLSQQLLAEFGIINESSALSDRGRSVNEDARA